MCFQIVNQQQRMGEYKHAHDTSFEMIQQLKNNNNIHKKELSSNLLLLHSYLLVKLLLKKNNDNLQKITNANKSKSVTYSISNINYRFVFT